MEVNKKFLPLGTVVLLNNAKEKMMIIGYLGTKGNKNDLVYDYQACMFPYGVYTNEVNFAFNHSDIKSIYYMGYTDDESKNIIDKLSYFEKRYISKDKKLYKSINDIISMERNVNNGK